MKHITASFLIPVFNEEKNIARCLDSILSQTFHDFEIIIVDDGSTDTTPEILSTYHDSRIIVYRQQNQGRASARNKALALSQGKYVILQDADDWSVPNRLEFQLSMAGKLDGLPIIGSGVTFHYEGNKASSVKIFPETDIRIKRRMARPILAGAMFPTTMLALRSQIQRLGGWREKFIVSAEDGDLVNRLFEDKETTFGNVPDLLYNYNLNIGSITNKLYEASTAQMFKRHCTRMRRKCLVEPESFNIYLADVRSNIVKRLLFEIELLAWKFYMQRQYK